jgi:SAM-dependent methyltransferase
VTDTRNLPVLKFDELHTLSQPPALYDPGEPVFWDDPHISKTLLANHLDPETDVASRRPATIDATLDWLVRYLDPAPGAAWLDLGCGPGLYTARLAQRGFRVTGVDFSKRSLAYARDYAAEHQLDITYRYQNYLTLEDAAQYDVISLIFGDFCPLFSSERAALLARVRRALKPGGRFVFDVSTPVHHARYGLKKGWWVSLADGFWRPEPHLVLEQGFAYPDDIYLNQYVLIEADGTHTVYRFWFQDYTPERITDELAASGFRVCAHWGDLTGMPYTPDSEWIGIVAEPA